MIRYMIVETAVRNKIIGKNIIKLLSDLGKFNYLIIDSNRKLQNTLKKIIY